jgi:hypothetical protein
VASRPLIFNDANHWPGGAVSWHDAVRPTPEDGDFIRLLTVSPDHDATYGKNSRRHAEVRYDPVWGRLAEPDAGVVPCRAANRQVRSAGTMA